MADLASGSLTSLFPGPALVTDPSGHLLAWSKAASEYLGGGILLGIGTPVFPLLGLDAPTKSASAKPDLPQIYRPANPLKIPGTTTAETAREVIGIPIQLADYKEPGHLLVFGPIRPSTSLTGGPINEAQEVRRRELQKCAHDLSNVIGILHNTIESASLEPASEVDAAHLIQSLMPVSERGLDLVRRLNELGTNPSTPNSVPPAATSADRREVGATSASSASTPTAGNERILLVEDELQYRLLVKAVLGFRGYRVTAAADGTEALQLAAEATEPYDLLITDFTLPDLDGLELFLRLQSDQPSLRHLVLSGLAPERESEEGVGRVNWMSKPFTNEQLLWRVRQVLDETNPPRSGK